MTTGAPLGLKKNVDGDNARTALNTDIPANFQSINDAIVTLTDIQTLTNKTLTSPVLNTPTFSAGAVPAAALAADVRPCVYALSNVPLSVANGADTTVPLQTTTYDTDNMHNNAINNERITFNTPGRYEVTVWLVWDTNVTGYRVIYVRNQAATILMNPVVMPVTGAETTHQTTFPVVTTTAGDFIAATCVQTSGGALNLNAARIFAKRIG